MQQRDFGRSGRQVSALVFGGGRVGGLLIDRDEDTRREAIVRAIAGGIDWIDTAPSYGDGASESALGWLLGELEERPRVSTKIGLTPEDLGAARAGPLPADALAAVTALQERDLEPG